MLWVFWCNFRTDEIIFFVVNFSLTNKHLAKCSHGRKTAVSFSAENLNFCGPSEAKHHIGITLSVVCPSVRLSVCHTFSLLINFFVLRDRAFIFDVCVPYDKNFPVVPWILITWPWPWPLTYIFKTLTLHITFLPLDLGLSYLASVFFMTPYTMVL